MQQIKQTATGLPETMRSKGKRQLLTNLTLTAENVSFAEWLPRADINNTLTCPNTQVGRTQNSLKDQDSETVSSSVSINHLGSYCFLYIPSAAELSSTLVLSMTQNISEEVLCFKE